MTGRWYFVAKARYSYRGHVVSIEGTIVTLRENSKIIDLGNGTHTPKEEIRFPDGMRFDLRDMEMCCPEPTSWGW